ncbi:hypothetical protein NC653_003473 [Populus alba x Populus x berolinensis]|uniref:Ribulose-phosphate 3-epimerase n=1 Tax=Populus alba x Populus x berolinensis TaxID=444605 RepID=A0AAD6WJ66_9ROSI|nr:hypothetical protein NC653_003473 [Populus alba x Populus x berolinensis]
MGVAAKIAPSMLSSDFANLASEAQRMLDCGADWLHMDIMDGYNLNYCLLHKPFILNYCKLVILFVLSLLLKVVGLSLSEFCVLYVILELSWMVLLFENVVVILFLHFVPNLTIGAPVIESLRKHTKAYLDCHLMVTNPLDYVEPLGKAGASGFTFHVEVSRDNWGELVQRIKSKGMRPGVSLKPGTPIEEVYPLVEGENPVEMVLVMTVEPGFGGQKFMPETMDKVRALRKKYPSLDIEVDGGLGPSTIDMAASAGANCIVAGSSVFGAPDSAQVISLLRKSVEEVQKNN